MSENSERAVTATTGRAHKRTAGGGTTNLDWWPNHLNLDILT